MPNALITGVAGQDGSYLAELLLDRGYRVHGMVRPGSSSGITRIEHLAKNQAFELHYADLCDSAGLRDLIRHVRPDEVYNLAGQSQVRISFEKPESTADATGLGALRLLEALRLEGCSESRFCQAASSEIFGNAVECPQSERTPLAPASPYAAAKAFAFHSTRIYRESYGMFAVNAILFNHESPRRGEQFVTRKITRAAARIKLGLDRELALGNLEARRDWGHAADYVAALWLMLRTDRPDDFVIATGETHSVADFLETAFRHVGLDWHDFVRVDAAFLRPTDVSISQGDATRARERLGWSPQKTFQDLVAEMVERDLELARLSE